MLYVNRSYHKLRSLWKVLFSTASFSSKAMGGWTSILLSQHEEQYILEIAEKATVTSCSAACFWALSIIAQHLWNLCSSPRWWSTVSVSLGKKIRIVIERMFLRKSKKIQARIRKTYHRVQLVRSTTFTLIFVIYCKTLDASQTSDRYFTSKEARPISRIFQNFNGNNFELTSTLALTRSYAIGTDPWEVSLWLLGPLTTCFRERQDHYIPHVRTIKVWKVTYSRANTTRADKIRKKVLSTPKRSSAYLHHKAYIIVKTFP